MHDIWVGIGLAGCRGDLLQRAGLTVLGIRSGDESRTILSKKSIIAPCFYLYMWFLQSLRTKLVNATTLLHKALLDLSLQLYHTSFSWQFR